MAMKQEIQAFLNLRRLPRIVNAEQTAAVLGIPQHYLQVLEREGVLRPLAARSLQKNCTRYYSTAALEALTSDDLEKIVRCILKYNFNRNHKEQVTTV